MQSFNVVLLPVNNLVVFPRSNLPFTANDKSAVTAIKDSINKDKSIVFLSTRISGFKGSEGVYKRGVIGVIKQVLEISDDTARIIIETFAKADLIGYTQKHPFLRVEVNTKVEPDQPDHPEFKDILLKIKMKLLPYISPDILERINTVDDIITVMMSLFNVPSEVLQKCLEQEEDFGCLLVLNEYLNMVKAFGPSHAMGSQDGKGMATQTMKSDKQEEIQEIIDKIKKINPPDHIKKELEKQLNKLARINPEMSEYFTTRNHVDWVLDIPWGVEDKSEIDLAKLKAELDISHYGLDDVKERILEYMAVQKLNGALDGSILCLIAPAGTGKTSITKSIAKALNRKFVKISLGGVRDEADIRGHRKTYVGSMPGKIIQALKQAGTMNPVILLDEIDKMGQDTIRGNPSSALLEALDPEQNDEFMDHFINLGVDISKVLFIATGNDRHLIDRILADRLEIITMDGYSEREKLYIANNHLIGEVAKETNIPNDVVNVSESALSSIINHYTMESGVRDLRRKIQAIYRKVAKSIVLGHKIEKVDVSAKNISTYLGPEKIHNDKLRGESVPGLVFGLAWTGYGGDVLPIEVVVIPGGKGKIEVTGNLGKVMDESVRVAIAYLKSTSLKHQITPELFKSVDFHCHFPEGATPKDGPSAGTAITLAIISRMKGFAVPKDTAFTGEITINGSILAVGGIKEKVMAAKRNGVRTVFLPKSNKKDVEKLDEKDVKDMTFNYVGSFEEVYNKFWPNT